MSKLFVVCVGRKNEDAFLSMRLLVNTRSSLNLSAVSSLPAVIAWQFFAAAVLAVAIP